MKEIINIIGHEMNAETQPSNSMDRDFRMSLMVIATILVSLMEWLY